MGYTVHCKNQVTLAEYEITKPNIDGIFLFLTTTAANLSSFTMSLKDTDTDSTIVHTATYDHILRVVLSIMDFSTRAFSLIEEKPLSQRYVVEGTTRTDFMDNISYSTDTHHTLTVFSSDYSVLSIEGTEQIRSAMRAYATYSNPVTKENFMTKCINEEPSRSKKRKAKYIFTIRLSDSISAEHTFDSGFVVGAKHFNSKESAAAWFKEITSSTKLCISLVIAEEKADIHYGTHSLICDALGIEEADPQKNYLLQYFLSTELDKLKAACDELSIPAVLRELEELQRKLRDL